MTDTANIAIKHNTNAGQQIERFNDNWEYIDKAIAGILSLDLAGRTTDYLLTEAEARYAIIQLNGATGAAFNIVFPAQPVGVVRAKLTLIDNQTTGDNPTLITADAGSSGMSVSQSVTTWIKRIGTVISDAIQTSGGSFTSHNHTGGAGDGGILTNDQHNGYSQYAPITTPVSPPPTGHVFFYAKGDGAFYLMDDTATEVQIGATGGGGGGGGTVATARKSADETFGTGITTLQDISDMVIAMASGEIWQFEICVFLTGSGANPGYRAALDGPAGMADLRSHFEIYDVNGDTPASDSLFVTAYGTEAVKSYGGAYTTRLIVKGVVINGATAGDLQFQLRPYGTSSAVTTVQENSYIIANKLG